MLFYNFFPEHRPQIQVYLENWDSSTSGSASKPALDAELMLRGNRIWL